MAPWRLSRRPTLVHDLPSTDPPSRNLLQRTREDSSTWLSSPPFASCTAVSRARPRSTCLSRCRRCESTPSLWPSNSRALCRRPSRTSPWQGSDPARALVARPASERKGKSMEGRSSQVRIGSRRRKIGSEAAPPICRPHSHAQRRPHPRARHPRRARRAPGRVLRASRMRSSGAGMRAVRACPPRERRPGRRARFTRTRAATLRCSR